MKKLLWLLLVGMLSAQVKVTVTGNVQSITGIAATSGYVEFVLQPKSSSTDYRIPSIGSLGPINARCGIDASGNVKNLALSAACQVWGNDVITPSGTAYDVIYAPNNTVTKTSRQQLIVGVGPYDLTQPLFATTVSVVPGYISTVTDPLSANIIPAVDNGFVLGGASRRWANGYFTNITVTSLSVIGGNLTVNGILTTTGNVVSGGNITAAGSITAAGNLIFDSGANRSILFDNLGSTTRSLTVTGWTPPGGCVNCASGALNFGTSAPTGTGISGTVNLSTSNAANTPGSMNFTTGSATSSGSGGFFVVALGNGAGTGIGGGFSLSTGSGTGTGTGGNMDLNLGVSNNVGGTIRITPLNAGSVASTTCPGSSACLLYDVSIQALKASYNNDTFSTLARVGKTQTWTAVQTFGANVNMGASIFQAWTGILFASLGTPANGSFIYCQDCTIANPCAGGGTGAFAKRLNGVWVCN